MPDIVELIYAEHARIGMLIGKLDSALAADGAGSEPALIWETLAGVLRSHMDAAAEIIYRSRAGAGPDVAPAAGQAPEIDADVCEAVAEAGLFFAGSPMWQLAVHAACGAAASHVACLESGLLTQYQLHTSPEARRSLGRQWIGFMTARALDASGC